MHVYDKFYKYRIPTFIKLQKKRRYLVNNYYRKLYPKEYSSYQILAIRHTFFIPNSC